MKKVYLIPVLITLLAAVMNPAAATETSAVSDYQRAQWNPLHFPPAIDSATNEQCLQCHQEVLERRVLPMSPSRVAAESVRAWYQTLTTYEGPQETFHRRHLVTPLAQEVMRLQCITCHQGNDPREEASITQDTDNSRSALRKQVDPTTCLMCHGDSPYEIMGLPSPSTSNCSAYLGAI